MLREIAPLIFLLLATSTSACAAPEDEEAAEDANALTGGPDLDNMISSAKEDGDSKGIKFLPAVDTAYQMGRPGAINYVVIHDIEGSGRSAVNTFRKPKNESSSHYVVDKNGKALQLVRERDIANHAFHSVLNAYAIGIEHAGFAGANDYTDAEYDASAELVAEIVKRHQIPIDRKHIVGHHQVPKTDSVVEACPENAKTCGGQGGHTDPGPNWKWDSYMALIKKKAAAIGYKGPSESDQASRALRWIDPMEKLSLSKPMFGGYWATQCQADEPKTQATFRTILKSNEQPRMETRYLQNSVGECGTAEGGVFPIIFRGFPTEKASRPDLDLTGLTVEQCSSGRKRVYRFTGKTVACTGEGVERGCQEGAATLVSETSC